MNNNICLNNRCDKPYCPEHSSIDIWRGEELLAAATEAHPEARL